MNFKNLVAKKEIKNAGWLIGGKVIQMILSFFIGLLTARYLGPSNYGVINYASAYVVFFTSLCNLGINSIIIKNFVDKPEEKGDAIGTAILLRIISSLLSVIIITCIVGVVDKGDTTIIVVAFLCSFSLVFQSFDTINYWFQAQYLSKITAIVTLVGYLSMSVYRVILLILKKNVKWFAFTNTIDYIVIALLLIIAYRRFKGPKFHFSWNKARELLGRSHHYILSGLMVAIYAQTDKLMLKHMIGETEVGYYSTAAHLCSIWVFVLQAIIDSMYPTILDLYGKDRDGFDRKNMQLYAIVFYVSVVVSLIFTFGSKIIIGVLYGNDFLPAALPLSIITWYTAFSYLGVARNAWLVCEKKEKYLKYLYIVAIVGNIIINFVLIPKFGAAGAATASLVTQIGTSIVIPLFFSKIRQNSILMINAIILKPLWQKK